MHSKWQYLFLESEENITEEDESPYDPGRQLNKHNNKYKTEDVKYG